MEYVCIREIVRRALKVFGNSFKGDNILKLQGKYFV